MPFVDYERLKFDYRNRVLWITIDAGKMNAVDFEMHEELARVFPEAQRDPDSDLIILTGAGRGFCAGGDVKEMERNRDKTLAQRRCGGHLRRG